MQSNSVLINGVIALLVRINLWYEHSILFRGVGAIKNAARGSFFLSGFMRTSFRDYWEGALLLRLLAFFASGVMRLFRRGVLAFTGLNESSVNRRVYLYARNFPFAETFAGKAVTGSAPYRLIAWFFEGRIALYKTIYMLFLCGALMIPGHFWNNGILLISALFFAGIFAVRWALSGEALSFMFISPALVLFVFFCALSIVTGYGGGDSLRVFLIFFACVVHSLLVTIMMRNRDELHVFIKLIAVTLAITALFGFYQLAVGIPIRAEFTDLLANPGMARLHSTMGGNPNNDAQAWAMLLPFVLAMIIAVRCDVKRTLLLAAVGICIAAFALTFSRAGYVALMAGVGIFVLMAAPRLVPIALIVLVLAIPFIPSVFIDRLLTLGTDTSSLYRFNIWRGVMDMLRDYWVRGIGMGPVAFAQTYRNYFHGEAWRALHAHNTFLDIIVHSGIGALIAFLAYLFRLIKRGISAHMNAACREYKLFTAAGMASLTVFIAFGVGEYVWFYPRVMLVFWICAGLLTGVTEMKD
ncbi:MAG: O-antigen ligase family protein [Defluviitaleaceae bacterium]|nr:O-antigen ligase family protein [Defluviitaleaceae bacterium]MCL2273510.1 O-antigen ligase family protein [Defluviitaleaceae bacterium]